VYDKMLATNRHTRACWEGRALQTLTQFAEE